MFYLYTSFNFISRSIKFKTTQPMIFLLNNGFKKSTIFQLVLDELERVNNLMGSGNGSVYLFLEKEKVLNYFQNGNQLSLLEFVSCIVYVGRDKYYIRKENQTVVSGRANVNKRIDGVYVFEFVKNIHFKLMECCEFIVISSLKDLLSKNNVQGTRVSIVGWTGEMHATLAAALIHKAYEIFLSVIQKNDNKLSPGKLN